MSIWIIGRGLYALNLINIIDPKYKLNLITSELFDIASVHYKIKKIFYIENSDKIGKLNYVEKIISIVKNDLIIPVGEESIIIEYILNKYPNLRNKINLFCQTINSNVKYLYHNKQTFYELLQTLNIKNLKTYKTTYTQIKLLSKSNKYLLKPLCSRGGIDQILIQNIDILHNINNLDKYLIQEYVENKKEYSVFALVYNGIIINNNIIIYEAINMIDGFAFDRKIISFESNISKKVIEIVEKIVKNISYSGFIGFDFISDDKNMYPIDYNPRVTNGISFFKKDSLDPINLNNSFLINYNNKQIITLLPYITSKKNILDIFYIDNDTIRYDFNIYTNIKIILMIILQLIYTYIKSLIFNKSIKEVYCENIIKF
jgi:hypothetical protein